MTAAKKAKRPHLGRGLESLLGPINTPRETSATEPAKKDGPIFPPDKAVRDAVAHVPLSEIQPNPYQPRTHWDDERLRELADSIRANGVIQPVLLRRTPGGYQLIAGERRVRAAEQAGLEEIPALVREASDAEMLELALVENIHRSDLNALERAMAYRQYLDSFSLTQTEAASKLGEDRSVIANYLRLLDLPQEVKDMLADGQLAMGHARAILALPTDDLRRKLANRAMAGRLSVREVERLVRLSIAGSKKSEEAVSEKPPHIIDLEHRLREALGTKVRIDPRKRGNRGRIIIDYYSLDEFDRLTETLGLRGTDTG